MLNSTFQTTLSRTIAISGIGLHGGRPVEVIIRPDGPDRGISIARRGGRPVRVTADRVDRVSLCTRFRADGGHVDTIEHLMAAFAIMGIDNAVVEVSGDELPILDGSAEPWAAALIEAGLSIQHVERRYLEVVRPFRFAFGDSSYEASPGPAGFDVSIEFRPPVGRQSVAFGREDMAVLLDARTFAFESDLERIRSAGLGRGGSLANAVVLDSNGPINPGGLRSADELVRHKALDLVGDLFVCGLHILGAIRADRPGHAANNAFLTAMIEERVALPTRTRESLGVAA